MNIKIKEELHKDDVTVGRNVKALRNRLNMSQSDLAEKLGVTFQQVQKYEKGSNRIAASKIVKLTHVLQCDLTLLFAGTGANGSVDVPLPDNQSLKIAGKLDKIDDPKIAKAVNGLLSSLMEKA